MPDERGEPSCHCSWDEVLVFQKALMSHKPPQTRETYKRELKTLIYFLFTSCFLRAKGFLCNYKELKGGFFFESWHSSARWDPEVEHKKNSLSSHDISKLVGNCTVISSSTFPPLYISSSPSFVVLFAWTTNKQYFLYRYIPIGLWCHWLRYLRTQLDPSRAGVLWTCRWILLLHYVKHQNQYSSVHCKVAAFFFFFSPSRESIVCAVLYKNSKSYEKLFPQAPWNRICSLITDQCVLIAYCRLLPIKFSWKCDTSKKTSFLLCFLLLLNCQITSTCKDKTWRMTQICDRS